MASAFQRSAFQNDAFQMGTAVTSLAKLQLPVDYFMVGLPQYREKYRTFEQSTAKGREDVTVTRSKRGRIAGPAPAFTTKTTKKGYD